MLDRIGIISKSIQTPGTKSGNIFVSIRNKEMVDKIPTDIKLFLENLFIHAKYANDKFLESQITLYEMFLLWRKFDFENISNKNKVSIREFLFVYFKDPFRFINISEKDHEGIYDAIKSRLPFYVEIVAFHGVLRHRYSDISPWIEDDSKLMDIYDSKTYIYLPNLSSKNIPETTSKKSIEAILKGIPDLMRLTNYSLITAAESIAQSSYISSELFININKKIPFSSLKKEIINYCFKSKNIDLNLHNIKLDGSSLIVYLANQLYNDGQDSKLSLTNEQKKQLQSYLDQVFAFTFFRFITFYHHDNLTLEQCFKAFDPIKFGFNTINIFFKELNFYNEKISNRGYKKILGLLNQIIAQITDKFRDITSSLNNDYVAK